MNKRLLCLLVMLASLARLFAGDLDPASGNAQPYSGTPIGPHVLAWSDEFNSAAVDTDKWRFRSDVRFWSTQQEENNSVANGALSVLLKKETVGATDYTAGGLISKKAFRYGYYEARMKTPPGAGWHTSFWMITGGTPVADTSIELDVVENDSINPLKYGVNTHRHLPAPHVTFGNKNVTTPSLSAGFHVYGCEFTAATIRYFFDGTLVQTVDATQFAHCDLNIWLTSVAAPLGGTTAVDESQLPSAAQFDYARFFLPAPPPPSVVITSPSVPVVSLADSSLRMRLAASVTASGPAPTVSWTQISGPGTATFGDPSSAETSATFSTGGDYVLQCAATAETGTGSAQVTVSVSAPAELTLRQGVNGYSHTATTIRADHTDWNAGARDLLLVGRNGGPMRALLSFDLSAVPSGNTITGAKLDLWTASIAGSGTIGTLELRALGATPTEGIGIGDGTSANNGTGSGATWLLRTPTAGWTTPGGDFSGTVLTSLAGYNAASTSVQRTLPSTASLVAEAQAAATAGQPLNLILSAANEAAGSNFFTRFASDDASVVEMRPRLTISFGGNPLPQVSPGPLPLAFAGSTTALAGVAANAVGTSWSVVSGPGPVTFANPSSPVTTAVFGLPGSYRLRFAGTNLIGESSRDLDLTVAPRTLQILPLGDSITQGAGLAGGYRDPLRTLLSNLGVRFQLIGSRADNANSALTSAGQAQHEGHSSYSSDLLLANLDSVLAPYAAPYGTPPDTNGGGYWLTGTDTRAAVHPDVILLMIGTNDLGMFRRTPEQTREFYDSILTKITTLRPTAHVVCATLIPYTGEAFPTGKDYSHREADNASFNNLLADLVTSHQAAGRRVRLHDTRTRINLATASTLVAADGVHPSQAGYAALASGWLEALQTLPLIDFWRASHFGSASSAAAADQADPDADGIPNLVEYALGLNPNNTSILPIATQSSGPALGFTYARSKQALQSGVTFQVQACETLGGAWTTPAASPETILSDDGTTQTVKVTVPLATSQRFLRLSVTAP